MLEFRILGPVEVLRDGEPVSLPRKKQRALLALLVLHAGKVVSTDELIEELWAGKPPATAKDALQNYVSQLRKALGADVIATRDPGYLLEAQPEQVDLGRFEALVAEARAEEDAAARAQVLRRALSLWRGSPLADLAYEAFTGLETARLEELRAGARDDLVDAELELGRGAELIGELEATVAERPFDERPRGQLMLALYRAGRQADALEAYQQARQTLVDELGLDPGAQLRELEQAILRQDPALQAPLAAPVVPEERRKTVTILFCDLVESTELAEALDPEVLRGVLDDYFGACRRAIERHGGTVEKFIGDAVMAVFGVPRAHEDDALRALRAAVEMRTGVTALSDAVEREQGLALDLRIGVNTGEVYVGDPGGSGLVTGNAVNLAKRLEQAAPSGSIMLGAGTLELARDAVRVKAVKTRTGQALHAFRLLELVEGAPAIARYFEAPLIGRDEELAVLRQAHEEACADRSPRLKTVVGEPGVGKTRLARELVAELEETATVLVGRCIAYGEGATFLPLRDMLGELDLTHIDDEEAELVARRVGQLVGEEEGTGTVDEGLWAVRRLFEALARERPLVLVFEDVHWAEPTLLDLIEQLAERASGPILVLAIARLELLDERPAWAERALVLEPLAADESVELLSALPGGEELAEEIRQRIAEIAAGNPLFAEQLFAYVVERGSEVLEAVPPSLEALLESRLDLLESEEQGVLRRAAVIGREFTHRALAGVSPSDERAAVSDHLFELVRQGLVRPDPGAEEAFRFHHVLVRDVAYNGLPKADRARLHERYADWLGEEPESLDEIVGYHLEQAYTYRSELGDTDRRTKQLAADAGARLGTAGMRSWRSGDVPSTIELLGRATVLLPENDAWRRELLCELGLAFDAGGDTARGEETLIQGVAAAKEALDARVTYRAQLELALVRLRRDPEGKDEALLDAVTSGVPAFEQMGDDRSLGRALLLAGWVHGGWHGQHARWEEAAEEALVHYRRAGFPAGTCLGQIAAALYYGPAHIHRAVARCEELLLEPATGPIGSANVNRYLGGLVAMDGEVDRGRELVLDAAAALDDFGQTGAARYCDSLLADVELLAGDFSSARQTLESFCAYCLQSEDFGLLATAAPPLAEVLLHEGAREAAEHWLDIAAKHLSVNDLLAQIAWRSVSARTLAHSGSDDEAYRVSLEAIAMARTTDALNARAKAHIAHAEVLHVIGRTNEADTALRQAIEFYEEKGNTAAVASTRLIHAPPA